MLQNVLKQLASLKQAKLIYEGYEFSAQQLVARCIELFPTLKKHHKIGFPLAFYLPNSPELLCWHLACFHLGITIIPIIFEENTNKVLEIIALTRPTCLITTSQKNAQLTSLLPSSCYAELIDKPFEELISRDSEAHVRVLDNSIVGSDDLAMIIFSSGTTGQMKGIMHSYRTTAGFMQTLIEILAIKNSPTYLVAQPMGHIGGITTTIITLMHDGTAILLKNFEIKNYVNALNQYQPTHINLHTPLFFEIINYPDVDRKAFKNIQTSFAGGDNIPIDLPEAFATKTGAKMQIGYGMTEIGIVMINRDPYDKHKGSCGKKTSSVEISLRDENGLEVPFQQPGEIWVKSPGCCLGYWEMPNLNQETLVDGWFKTGDLAYLDQEGYYWYKDRASHVIHRGDHVIYPDVIEQALFHHPSVKSAAVVARTTPSEGQVPIAFVELKDKTSTPTSNEEIMQYIAEKLPLLQRPEKIIILKKMPLNLTGKIDRQKLINTAHLFI